MNPTTTQIRAARVRAGLTQSAAAEVIHLGARERWTEYERGTSRMPQAKWELFLLKTNQTESK